MHSDGFCGIVKWRRAMRCKRLAVFENTGSVKIPTCYPYRIRDKIRTPHSAECEILRVPFSAENEILCKFKVILKNFIDVD